MRYSIYSVFLLVFAVSISSCSKPSLQKYLVEKQDDNSFVKMDIASSLLQNDANLSDEQRETLKTIKKINVVAYPIIDGEKQDYEKEHNIITEILASEEYKTLIYLNSPERSASLKYTGNEEAIDELIVFGSDEDRGFAVLRILGNDMRPKDVYELMKTVQSGDMDLSKFSEIAESFKD